VLAKTLAMMAQVESKRGNGRPNGKAKPPTGDPIAAIRARLEKRHREALAALDMLADALQG
jgi:hypothetical protein